MPMSSATCSAVNGARACQRRNASDSTAAHSSRASNPSNCRTSPANVAFAAARSISRTFPSNRSTSACRPGYSRFHSACRSAASAQARGEGQPSPLPVAAVLFIAGVARLPRLAIVQTSA